MGSKEYQREYYQKNIDKKREYRKNYNLKNNSRIKKQQNERYKKYVEERKLYKKNIILNMGLVISYFQSEFFKEHFKKGLKERIEIFNNGLVPEKKLKGITVHDILVKMFGI